MSMFLVGVFSTPIPYLLFLLCYGVSFAYSNLNERAMVRNSQPVVLSYNAPVDFTGEKVESNMFRYSDWRTASVMASKADFFYLLFGEPRFDDSSPKMFHPFGFSSITCDVARLLPNRAPPVV